ncbi:MAG: hypothetical protein HKL90_11335 [Elusimicrobia bacterium]|nr:hypothetical protein [Elusimicrobiota bacterium]
MTSLLACFLLACAAGAARADARTGGPPNSLDAQIDGYSRYLARLPPGGAECSDSYRALEGKDVLRIGVFFGFADAGAQVVDQPIRRALVAQLAQPCRENLSACGFAVEPSSAPDGPATLTKTQTFGGRRTKIVLDVVDSSVDESYARDVGARRVEQEAKSRATTERYLAALHDDDAILYAGHARYGTGPGFCPLPFFSLDSVMTYVRRPLLARMKSALADPGRAPAVIGILSCDSRHLYAGSLHDFAPRSSLLVTTDLTTHFDNALAALGFIDSLLARRCGEDFQKSLNEGGFIFPFELDGFFTPAPRYGRSDDILRDVAALFLLPFLAALASRPRERTSSVPLSARSAARDGLFLVLCLAPGPLIAARFSGDTAAVLPYVFGLAGGLLSVIALRRREFAPRDISRLARRVRLPLFSAAGLCFLLAFQPEPSTLNALASALHALRLAAYFAVFLPFFIFAENRLLAPFSGDGAKGLAATLGVSGAFYYAVFFALNHSGARLMIAGPFTLAFVLGGQLIAFLLCRGRKDVFAAAVFQALTLAWIFAAGLQGALYY